jgi:hypothetical protein
VGSAKWSRRRLGKAALQNLLGHAAALPGYEPSVTHLLYGRTGCGAGTLLEANARCFSLEDMYD